MAKQDKNPPDNKQERLAQMLRMNLLRRKKQTKSRKNTDVKPNPPQTTDIEKRD